MPNRQDHLDRAKHNSDFAATINPHKYGDWVAVALFYSALHYIDAFLDTVGVQPGKHQRRDSEVSLRKELRPLSRHYFHMKTMSMNARYNPPITFQPKDLAELKTRHLAAIQKALAP